MTKRSIRKALLRSAVALSMTFAITLAMESRAGDFRRTPDYASEASQEVKIEEFRELLRLSQEGKTASSKSPEETSAGQAVPAKPASGQVAADPQDPGAAGQDVAGRDPKNQDQDKSEPEGEKKPTEAAVRAGCMYRGTTLIWEKVPGTCAP